MLVGWAVLSPLSKLSGWAPGPVGDMSNGARGWILWVSLGIMCADSLVSLVPVAIEFITDIIWSRKKRYSALAEGPYENHETETEDRLVPNSWVATGLFVSIVVGTLLVWVVFGNEGIKAWATLCGFVLGGLLSIIGWVFSLQSPIYLEAHFLLQCRVRALGETDLNPVSGLGKISQLFFAWIQPGNIVANIIAGGVAEAGAQQ